jgi:3-hydroxyacyl-[acyl-carrier-protein] dehydratase
MRLEYFEMIDRVEAFDAKRGHIQAIAKVPDWSPVFEGHFPSFPVMPGVLLLETMNHAAGYVMLGLNGWTRMPFFAGVKRIKIKRFVTPGMIMNVSADLLHEGSGFCVCQGEIKIDGEAVAEAEITLMQMKYPSVELNEMVKDRARLIGIVLEETTA